MNIWKLKVNETYNQAFLVNEKDEQINDNDSYFTEKQYSPFVRKIAIDVKRDGFADVTNYWGTSGSCVVNDKVKNLIEQAFNDSLVQFFPCYCSQYPNNCFWILNAFDFRDVLDLDNSEYRTLVNLNGDEVIYSVKKYVFTKDAYDLDIFKIILSGQKDTINLFVSDRFKNIMEKNGVTGLVLEKVYEF